MTTAYRTGPMKPGMTRFPQHYYALLSVLAGAFLGSTSLHGQVFTVAPWNFVPEPDPLTPGGVQHTTAGGYTTYQNLAGGTYWHIYDDFQVPSSGWTITRLSGRFSTESPSWSQDYWEIHADDGGSIGALIASGIGATAPSVTGRVIGTSYTEFYSEVDGLNVQLPQGTYWMMLAPALDSQPSGAFGPFLGQTLDPLDGVLHDHLSYIYNNVGGPIGPLLNVDQAYGIAGLAEVPEPCATGLVCSLVIAVAAGIRRLL